MLPAVSHHHPPSLISQKTYIGLVNLALSYAERGWPVFPLHSPLPNNQCSCKNNDCKSIGKHPRTLRGLKDATTNIETITQWWKQWPEANIGIATGSPSKLVVLDVDHKHSGELSWQVWLLSNPIPPTVKVYSGAGYHLYFTSEKSFKSKVGVLTGVDIRADGGYIVAPGSLHGSLKRYAWSSDTVDNPIATLPESLEKLIQSDSNISPENVPQKLLIPEGERNITLTSLAGVLRKRGLTEETISQALMSFNNSICASPLDSKEINNIVKSISRYQNSNFQWGELKPIQSMNLSVPKLHENLIPSALRPWISDIADRMQVPLEFLAAPVIVTLSSIIGRQLGVYPKQEDDWLVVPNLWGAVIARPGFFKSPAISEAMKPLDILTKQASLKYEAEKILVKAKDEVLKAKIEGLKDSIKKVTRKGNDHEIPLLTENLEKVLKEIDENVIHERRYKTNDATIEKLACLLNENPQGILVVRDELSGWLKSMQKSGREGDREFYLEAWNGYGSYSVDRIGRGTLHVPALCVAIFGGLQPGKIEAYLTQAMKGSGDDGLLQRFQILVYPETPKKWRNVDRKPNLEAFNVAKEVFEAIASIKIKSDQNTKIPGLHFSEEAQTIFTKWRENLEKQLRTKDSTVPVFESHLAKYRSLVPSLALIFHLVENYKKASFDTTELIGADSVTLAIKWSDFLEAHAKKIYANALFPNLSAAHALASRIAKNELEDKASMRSIYRRHWTMLDSLDKLEAAISILEEANWVRVETVKVSSTTTEILRINPSLGSSELLTQFR